MASYNLNLIPGDAPVVVHVNQYDYGYPIDFTVYDGDTVFSLSGYTAVINIGKADRNVYVGGTVVLRGNTATVTLEEQMTAMWGPCIAEIVFTNTNGRRATANFILDVEKSPLEDGAESESVINYIEDARESTIAATEAAYEAATAASNAVGAAQSAADAAAGIARNIEAMPEVLQQLASTLVDVTGINKLISLDQNGDVTALSAGYVTPQMFGAKGDGTTDDTTAFEDALASGAKVVIPVGTYKLTEVLWSDDSVVVSDSGTYNTKPLVVSRDLRESAPVERIIKQFNASTDNIRDYSLRGACYDSTNNRIVVAYGVNYTNDENTDLILTAYDTDFNPITNMSKVIADGGQGTGICYDPAEHKIYITATNGSYSSAYGIVDPDTLTVESWNLLFPLDNITSCIMYDYDNNIAYIMQTYEGDCKFFALIPDDDPVSMGFDSCMDEVKEAVGLSASDTLIVEQSIVFKGQILQLLSGNGAAYIAQYDYTHHNLKKAYRVSSHYLTGDEPKALVNVDGIIYMLTDIANTSGQRCVSVSQLLMDERIDGHLNVYEDARVLGGADLPSDLNDILTVGCYAAPVVSVATNLTNSPTTQAFVMWVLPVPIVKESRAQVILTYHGDIFVRTYVAHVSIWYGWRQLAETPRKGATKTGLWDGVGYVTSSGTEVRFTIPHPMPSTSDAMPSITVTSCKVNIRQNENYLVENSLELIGASGYVVSATASPFGVRVTIKKSSAFPNVINNAPCGVSATVTLRFT